MAEISDYLQELNEQVVQEESKIQVVENPVVDLLLSKLEEMIWQCKKAHLTVVYDTCLSRIQGVEYSADDILSFSTRIASFEELIYQNPEAIGKFISALVNNCKEEDIGIFTKGYGEKIDYLGCRNEKNLTIIGDTGNNTGHFMIKGSLTVTGNAGVHTGMWLESGQLLVEGSTEHCCGVGIKGGKIIIKGRAGTDIGGGSTGGEIYIEQKQDREQLGRGLNCNARIYYEGKQVWPE